MRGQGVELTRGEGKYAGAGARGPGCVVLGGGGEAKALVAAWAIVIRAVAKKRAEGERAMWQERVCVAGTRTSPNRPRLLDTKRSEK